MFQLAWRELRTQSKPSMKIFCDNCACSPPRGQYGCLKEHPIVYVSHQDPETKKFNGLMIRADMNECPDFVDMVSRPTRFERILDGDLL